MTAQEFVACHEPEWTRVERLLSRDGGPAPSRDPAGAELPALHRRLCGQLAIARDRGYPPHVVDRLNHLVAGTHRRLYRGRAGTRARVVRFLLAGFPATVRGEWRIVAIAAALLVLPGAGLYATVRAAPEVAYSVVDGYRLAGMEEMYRSDVEKVGRERDSGDDIAMFGYYVWNNIGLGFRAFASGIALGIGTALVLLYNGLFLGTVAAHLDNVGHAQTFYPFVVGHGALELPAIVLCGAAGLKLGGALLAPGRLSRAAALRRAAREGLTLLWGAAAMLLAAAFVEAFWSSTTAIPPAGRYLAGGTLWLLVAAYLVLAGRARDT